jgi:uncharacterized protein YndB with AHSA1/START domain
MTRSTFIYVTYIRTAPEKLWSALADDVEFMNRYWFGKVTTTLKPCAQQPPWSSRPHGRDIDN